MRDPSLNILIVEDDKLAAVSLQKLLQKNGHNASWADSVNSARKFMADSTFQLAFVDLDLDRDSEGFELIPALREKDVYTAVVTAHSADIFIERAYDIGCDDYVTKPFHFESIERVISNCSTTPISEARFDKLIASEFLTQDQSLLKEVERLRDSFRGTAPIFFYGSSGVGKTVLAGILHRAKFGSTRKFIELNCSAIPEDLLESELFGHMKGSFTGADKDKIGKLVEADGGTLFLDEIATMPLKIQQKLLKAIAEKRFSPVGSNKVVESDFRIMSATCNNIFELIKEGKFRDDLFYRITGTNVTISGLAERREDIGLLIGHFKSKMGRAFVIKPKAEEALLKYDWPGNVREMASFFESIKGIKKPIIDFNDLPRDIQINNSPFKKDGTQMLTKAQIRYIERHGLNALVDQLSLEAFQIFDNGNMRQTVRKLGVGFNRYYSLKERKKRKSWQAISP